MSFVVTPLAVEYITIDVVENATTVRLVIAPLALIASAIWPSLLAKPVTEATQPLTTVHCSVFKGVLAFFSLLLIILIA